MLKYVFPRVVKYWEYSDDQGRHATSLYRITVKLGYGQYAKYSNAKWEYKRSAGCCGSSYLSPQPILI